MTRRTHKWWLTISFASAFAVTSAAAIFMGGVAEGQGGDKPKNIKTAYLRGKSRDEIKRFMKEKVAKGLGVQCDFCHNLDDMAADTPKKNRSREMIEMTATINKKYMKGKESVSCVTCHRGKEEPDAK